MNPYLLLGGAVALVLAIAAAIFGINAHDKRVDKAGYDRAMGLWSAATAKAEAAQRKIELERLEAQRKAQDAHEKEVTKARNDAARARTAADGLRSDLAELSRRASSNTTVAKGSPTSATVGDILGECGARYSSMALEADAAYLAGTLCVASYETLGAPK